MNNWSSIAAILLAVGLALLLPGVTNAVRTASRRNRAKDIYSPSAHSDYGFMCPDKMIDVRRIRNACTVLGVVCLIGSIYMIVRLFA